MCLAISVGDLFGNDSKLPNSFPLKMNECYLFKGTISKGKGKENVFQSHPFSGSADLISWYS